MTKIIRAKLPITYTLAGDNRDASATQAADAVISFKSLESAAGEKDFSIEEIKKSDYVKGLHVCKARLVSDGAPGLNGAPGKLAAEITVIVGGKDYKLSFSNYNDWEGKDIIIDITGVETFAAKIKAGSVLRVNDFNVQNKFVGQAFSAILEIAFEDFYSNK